MQRHTIRDADLALWQSGNGDRDLVFVHGFQNDHTAWRPLVERLDDNRYRYTCFDLLGCGASGGASTWERCTISEYGADLTAVCDVLDVDRPVVLGHSLGELTFRVWYGRWRAYNGYSPRRLYYRFRNFVLLMRCTYVPWRWKLRACWYWLGNAYAYLLFSPNRLANLRFVCRGLWDGLRGRTGPCPESVVA